MKKYIFSLLLACLAFGLHAIPLYGIYDPAGQQLGLVVGVFHSGYYKIPEATFQIMSKELDKYQIIAIEESPIGGWDPELAKRVLVKDGISMSNLMKNNKLKCLIESQHIVEKMGDGYKALYESGPTAYIEFMVQPDYFNVPKEKPNKEQAIDFWLYKRYGQDIKKVIYLEDHLEPFNSIGILPMKTIGDIAESNCEFSKIKMEDKSKHFLDLSRMLTLYGQSNVNELREYIFEKNVAYGWPRDLLLSTYKYREKLFIAKIVEILKSNNGKSIFALGAMHLGGDGVLDGLRKNGYLVKECQITNSIACKN